MAKKIRESLRLEKKEFDLNFVKVLSLRLETLAAPNLRFDKIVARKKIL
jgi:hypothetical protein